MAEPTTTNGMQPLPLQNVQAGIVPLGSVTKAAPTVDDTSPVDEWLAEDNKFEDTAPVAEVPQPETPVAETPTTEPVAPTETAPTAAVVPAAEAKPDAPVATAPEAKPTVETPAKPTYAADEKFGLADGVEWTREQIIAGLKERAQFQPLAAEAQGYQQLFGMPLEDAKKAWGPILQRLASEQHTVQFLDSYLSDPKKAEYLNECSKYFDQNNGGAPATATPAATTHDPTVTELRNQVTELKTWQAKQLQDAANARASREIQTVTEKYPFLNTDAQARDALFKLAMALHNEDVKNGVPDLEARGILEAVQMNAALYDARLIAERQQLTQPAPAALEVPAVLGSQGASPGGSRQITRKPESNVDLNEAVEDWLATDSKHFQ